MWNTLFEILIDIWDKPTFAAQRQFWQSGVFKNIASAAHALPEPSAGDQRTTGK